MEPSTWASTRTYSKLNFTSSFQDSHQLSRPTSSNFPHHTNTFSRQSLPEIIWPHNARSSQLFWDEAFVVLTNPVPSTNYHNGNDNMQSIVWLWDQDTHTIHDSSDCSPSAYWSLYTWASKPFQHVFYGRAIRHPSLRDGCLIVSDKSGDKSEPSAFWSVFSKL